ncbi:type II toxin-antitoxin system RelE/ParE family toxin [Pseudoduganella violacea]|uniref:Plasmid stabilization system protein ParE n=1 Tax=Pseudoduganella violacea TaxID=1715466 RepID=A0A7W5FWS7_9BURK|nr:type II toxin-antitoxin system RelE/ParE family toxin [Pseudoduganella violacea]MBB3122360.1 plasmid stabilization system protein ParE [Pseudoduganella violacea]
MRLLISRRAACDLDEIAGYIARHNLQRAASFVVELRQQCQALTRMPLAFRARSDVFPGLRICSYQRYLILYRAEGGAVHVLRIAHSARDLRALLQ